MDKDLLRRLPKTDLHVHLDGSLRLSTLVELARERRVALPSEAEEGLRELVFRPALRQPERVPPGVTHTVAVLQDAEALERVTFELCEDCQAEGVRYAEIRFAPQLHVRPGFDMNAVVAAVDRGIRRASEAFNRRPEVASGREPRFAAGIILCALRYFTGEFSPGYLRLMEALPESSPAELHAAASIQVARAAARLRHDEGLLVVGIDLAGQEKGYPAEEHRVAYQIAHEAFLGKTVHAGEDYGPESIFQAIGDLHADRIGHGTWLFDDSRITPAGGGPPRVRGAARAVHRRQARDHRGVPDVQPADRAGAGRGPAGPPLRRDAQAPPLDDLLHRQPPGVEHDGVQRDRAGDRGVRPDRPRGARHPDLRLQAQLLPRHYLEKRAYVRGVIDYANRLLDEAGVGRA
jgi:adenosine deaminase